MQTPLLYRHTLIVVLLAFMPGTATAHQAESETPTPETTPSATAATATATATATAILPAITVDGNRYTVFDRQLNEHVFVLHENGHLQATDHLSGNLEQLSTGRFLWIDVVGNSYRFNGSWHQTSTETFAARSSTTLSNARTNTSATGHECQAVDPNPPDPDGQEIPDNTDTSSDTDTDTDIDIDIDIGTDTDVDTDPLDTDDASEPEQCDTDTAGPHTFQPTPYDGLHTTLDARPASCQSYFVQYYGTDRGFAIESGLDLHAPYNSMQATLRTFPVIDFMDDNGLYVVHSRDLGNRTFNSPTRPNALLDQLLEDGEQIQTRFLDVLQAEGSITASELGQSTTITANDVRPITLQLVIRDGMASASHWQQIAIAREQLQTQYGVTLAVVIIP